MAHTMKVDWDTHRITAVASVLGANGLDPTPLASYADKKRESKVVTIKLDWPVEKLDKADAILGQWLRDAPARLALLFQKRRYIQNRRLIQKATGMTILISEIAQALLEMREYRGITDRPVGWSVEELLARVAKERGE